MKSGILKYSISDELYDKRRSSAVRWPGKTGGAIRPAKGGIDFFCYFFASRQKSKEK
jgi:hypothetical protein